ncbi:MAG: TIGR02281 family clan AA aspartic protease [Parvularculaceae bacterium]|nr:TIGR02281 family clan AA aspartic protease [Parvularculaceae bacterium]
MREIAVIAGVVVLGSVIAVRTLDGPTPPDIREPPTIGAAIAPPPQAGEVRLTAGANHQFFVTAAVNGRPSSFLVDTGASFVALRDSEARAANIYVTWADYKHPVRTANGDTKAAMVEVDVIEIDKIRVENVTAFILPDDQLAMNLLGMSFLSQLESVEARGRELVLKG